MSNLLIGERMKIGKAVYRNGKLHFDRQGWQLIKAAAKRKHQSPKKIVTDALWRMYAKETAKNVGN